MDNLFSNINWWSVVVATLILIFFGFIYYSPKVFGGVWMNSLGYKPEDFARRSNMKVILVMSILMSVCVCVFLTNRTNGLGQEGIYDTFKHGAFHGAFLGLIVVLPVLIINGLWELRTYKNLAINALYWTITFSLMGGVLDAMNHWPNA